MSQPPQQQQQNNPYGSGAQQQRGPGGSYNSSRPMGAWQPAAPTSLQMASQQGQQQPNPQPYGQQQQQQQQPMGRGGGYTGPPPQMNPYAYNTYAQQYPPQQGRVQSWNPAYAGTMYGNPNPAMYYPPQGGPQMQPQASIPGVSTAVAVPAPRPKKILVITDKDGNPIDLSNVKKSSNPNPSPAPVATTSDSASTAASSFDAGAKLRQAVLERLQGAEASKKMEDEEAAKKKTEEEEAGRLKMAQEEEETKKKQMDADAAAAKKKAEEEAEAAKKAEEKTKAKSLEKPKSSLSDMLSRQEGKKRTATEPERVAEAPAASIVLSAPEGNNSTLRSVYSKEEMLRLKSLPVCMTRPDDLPPFVITKGPSRGGDRERDRDRDRGGVDRRQQRDGGGGGGGGGSWQRGAAAPRRTTIENKDSKVAPVGGGGGQWIRGQAPPPQVQEQDQGQGGRGGHGGRGGRDNDPPFFDGPVVPLKKSENGWRPKKSTSVFDVAEKLVKGVLNKMTKEKFDRLASVMCDIPVVSYQILTMMIGNVYEKAIDEPTFGDMYGDLCVKLSQQVQTDSFVQIIESDEEPPTEDGEAAGEAPNGQPSTHSTYRWSHDVSTSDSELVGPFPGVEECFEIALSGSEQDRIERGDMELELVKLQIKGGMFIKILKKKSPTDEGGETKEGEKGEYYTVYFPVANHVECGQQLSKIFLSEPESRSDASKQNSFKRTLLNKCEDEFKKQDIYVDWKMEKAAYEETKSTLTEAERAEKEVELDFRRIKIKKQMIGNIKFIGQLYKKNLLKERIMRFCIASLLKLEADDESSKIAVYHDAGDGDMDEEDHEAICNLLGTIGSTIDKPAASHFIGVCFAKINRLSNSKDLPSRSRFMYKDLLELRQNNWVPRRKDEKAKTIDEIRKDFEQEERAKQQQSEQMNSNSRGGGRNDYGNRQQDNRRVGGDFRSNIRTATLGGGGGGARRVAKPASETDDDGFTTIVTGVSKSRSSLAQAASGQAPSLSAKLPTKQSFAALADENLTISKPTPEALDDDRLKRRVQSICTEYMQDPSNIDELLLSMEELTGTQDYRTKFVQFNCDKVIDCKDDERAAIYAVHAILVDKGKLTSEDVKAGMIDMIEFIDSFVCDAPKAFDYLGDMLTAMIKVNAMDLDWICEHAEKTKDSGEENPHKIVQALATSMKMSLGADEAKSILDASATTVAALIGAEKFASIKAGL